VANPAKKLESLLRLHRFELVSQRNHLKYKNPQGKIFVMGKTPSDFRADHKALAVFQRVISSPVPTSEVIEEERQRRELEATIALRPQPRPSTAGISGAGRSAKSKGTGIYYEAKVVPTAEQLAHREETRQRALANQAREYEKSRVRREERREQDEWARQLSKFRRASRQVTKDVRDLHGFMQLMTLLRASRSMAASMLRENANEIKTAEQRGRLLDAILVLNHARADGEEMDEEFKSAVANAASTDMFIVGQFLMHRGGRAPRWFPASDETINISAQRLRLLRRTVAWVNRGQVEGATAIVTLKPLPDWLGRAIGSLQLGVNRIEETQ
jgi:hypothetical protein